MADYAEKIMWEDIRRDMKYPAEDNNLGLIYGLCYVDYKTTEALDYEWFKSDAEREVSIVENNITIVI